MTIAERTERTAAADRLCREAYEKAGGKDTGTALVAVGGYGRGELAPYSDLDVVLVHDDDLDPGELAVAVWYPLWDSGSRLDHSVRSVSEMIDTAGADLKVALGLLDVRHLAGDPNLTLRLRATALAAWRRSAKERLPELARMVRHRHELVGELAHVSVPDLKEAAGGLRDASVLKALVATWLVDVPHVELERGRQALLDVRDHLHAATGRPADRVGPEVWPELAGRLGLADAEAAQRHVRQHGRRIAHLSRMTWRRVDAVLARPRAVGGRVPQLTPLARGVASSSGEVVLDGRVEPATDPLLLLRAATEAAERDLVLAPATVSRLVKESPELPDPWPEEARHLMVRLLAAGPGLLAVWETLEETGGLDRILPEWDRVRLLPHASVVHRFTVDRHVVETCVEASRLIRRVARPDLLMVAALLHDIGKGGLVEHSVAGEPVARGVATRMGFVPRDVEVIGTLVRWHLLLPGIATTRDIDDPVTVDEVTSKITSPLTLELLAALTEADALAASEKAWSSWRAGLVGTLVRRAAASLDHTPGHAAPLETTAQLPVPPGLLDGSEPVAVQVEPSDDGSRITVLAPDRVGLLADVAGALALHRVSVRGARAWAQGELGVSQWEVSDPELDATVLRQRLEAVVEGRVEVAARLRKPDTRGLDPSVAVRPEASRQATVLEVRAADRPGLLHHVLAAVAALGMTVRSAHVDTLGPQAVDVFYLQELGAGGLADDRAASAAHAVRAALA
ncbi:[protein-PII] uridylyltransferase [Nocardioides campestrisoli]|uniref:[protein-PII] uridylyltransferase n=1 Tax=Nocardioides campestrisoli TaxID=2736757 RepID=UPI00163DBB5B|nr:[protein-PII] uridylyltransferase [Nocardioides campestrisoli]